MILEALAQHWPSLGAAYVLYIVGMLSPGPNVLSIVATSMSAGRAAGKAQALGVASGTFGWGMTSWLGLTAILSLYAGALTAIKIFGAIY
ncbi:MAG: LysE family transporter, partial [Alphaproteobacteria bacterium]